jgi:hypothetical protein
VKEQAELIKAQNEAEANKPVRLAAFECIICMSNPTDLTVTHCGMYSLGCGVYGYADWIRPPILLRMSSSCSLRW